MPLWFNWIASFFKIWERTLSPNSSMRLPQMTLTLCRAIGFIRPSCSPSGCEDIASYMSCSSGREDAPAGSVSRLLQSDGFSCASAACSKNFSCAMRTGNRCCFSHLTWRKSSSVSSVTSTPALLDCGGETPPDPPAPLEAAGASRAIWRRKLPRGC